MFKWLGNTMRWGVKEVSTLTNFKQIRDVHDEVRHHAETVLNPFVERKGREETFQNAYTRLGLDEATLQRVYNNHRLRFYISLIFMMGGFGLLGAGLLSAHWWTGIPALAVVIVCLAQMFSGSLRAYQINHRELVGVDAWWAASTEWWPGPFVTLDEFEKKAARAERRAARRSARKSSASTSRDLTTSRADRKP